MNNILIITGQTATGKTSFAVEIAKKFNGELISADSRQVYKGMDIITGKDKAKISVPIHLYDLADTNKSFSVSQWRQKALTAITDISARGKLPIVVGGSGLYLRSLVEDLDTVDIPPDPILRKDLSQKSVSVLFDLLGQISPIKAESLNNSDRHNPRRLIRAIEIAMEFKKTPPPLRLRGGRGRSYKELRVMYLVMTCPTDLLKSHISERVHQRIKSGAFSDFPHLTSLYSTDPEVWINNEYQYARRQKVFFQKYFPENSVDISDSSWHSQLLAIITSWLAT